MFEIIHSMTFDKSYSHDYQRLINVEILTEIFPGNFQQIDIFK